MNIKTNILFIILFLNSVPHVGFSATQDPCPQLTQNLIARINGGITQNLRLERSSTIQFQGIVFESRGRKQGTNKGEQPDLEACAAESWAEYKAGNSDSRITDWYFNQFFKSPRENGLEGLAEAAKLDPDRPIITFALSTNVCLADLEKPLSEYNPKYVQSVKDITRDFKILFSLSEGRKLAYRLLIEIYRKEGQLETIINTVFKCRPDKLSIRNAVRHLIINFDKLNAFSHSDIAAQDGILKVNIGSIGVYSHTIQEYNESQNIVKVSDCDTYNKKPQVISSGHELIHWFHYLRNPVRNSRDRTGNLNAYKFGVTPETISFFLYQDLEGQDDNKRQRVSMLPWSNTVLEIKDPVYAHEEHLTIIGAHPCIIDQQKFFFGDELSENKIIQSYNTAKNEKIPLRGGYGYTNSRQELYSLQTFYEDARIFRKMEMLPETSSSLLTPGRLFNKQGIGNHRQQGTLSPINEPDTGLKKPRQLEMGKIKTSSSTDNLRMKLKNNQ